MRRMHRVLSSCFSGALRRAVIAGAGVVATALGSSPAALGAMDGVRRSSSGAVAQASIPVSDILIGAAVFLAIMLLGALFSRG